MFTRLDKQYQINKASLPFWAPVTIDPDKETAKDIEERHKKFLTLKGFVQDKLLSSKTEKSIQEISASFNLGIIRMASIARAVRNYYFGTLSLQKFPQTFSQEMGIDQEKARKIAQQVIERIIHDDSFEKSYQQNLDELTFKEALQKYPTLKKQVITNNPIQIKNSSHAVSPSIENWITDYNFNLGYEKHDAIQRSRYLFQGKISSSLSEVDRQKIAFILKAFDENSPVKVDKNKGVLIFPEIAPPDLSKVTMVNKKFSLIKKGSKFRKLLPAPFKKKLLPQPKKEVSPIEENVQKTEFDFHQKMPFENQQKQSEITEKKISPYRIVPLSKKEDPRPDEETFHIEKKEQTQDKSKSKNIVNLREL